MRKRETTSAPTRTAALLLCALLCACSTTRNLPQDEILYTGIRKIEIKNREGLPDVADEALTESEAALACAPNNSLFGSSSLRFPLPLGLWWYNATVDSRGKIGKWLYKSFAAEPVLMSDVRPQMRSRIATNVLHNYGYFHSTVSYNTVAQRNPRKQKVDYSITLNQPLYWDSIAYTPFPPAADSLLRGSLHLSGLQPGGQFTVNSLNDERNRIAQLLRNNGFYYFQPGYVVYTADTLRHPGKADLRVSIAPQVPYKAIHPWSIGKVNIYIIDSNTGSQQRADTVENRRFTYIYTGSKKPPVRPGIFFRRLSLRRGELYTQQKQSDSYAEFSRMNIFSSINFNFVPRDTTQLCDSLDLNIFAQLDKPYDLSVEMNVTTKSNNQAGPGVVASLERKNVFRGGETFKLSLLGSYEWQTDGKLKGRRAVVNSWEIGADASLKIPRIYLPFVDPRRLRTQGSSSFHLSGNQLNRSGFFKMVSAGGEVHYTFTPQSTTVHTVIPFRLDYTMLQRTTARFDSIVATNKALAQGFKDQFIPAMQYSYTYDNAATRHRNKTRLQVSLTEAGNITSLVYMALGRGWNQKDKEIVYNPYAQFVKSTAELCQLYRINSGHSIATRLYGGIIIPYGNSSAAPYSEQFSAGGASDIRAFTIRTIGPGSYHPASSDKYSYLDETGTLKLEANVEYRMKLFGDLQGALFADAGNVWLTHKESSRPGGLIRPKTFLKEVALGTGVGLRYDLSFLVLRLDWGIPLHTPYDTGKSGYLNTRNYISQSRLHFAIGYPF